MRLLLIEDNDKLAAGVVQALAVQNYAVDRRATLADAGDALDAGPYDLILLDLGMPDGDGCAFLQARRRAGLQTPVLVLTARGGLDDRVAGLDAGADDYLVKPFETAELAARCRALLRRPGAALGVVLQIGDLEVDSAGHTVTVSGRAIQLPPREFALLEALARKPGAVVSRETLEHSLYSMDRDVSPNALEASASRLRRRLAEAGAGVRLRTAHGVGYALAAVEEETCRAG